jgi:hypothetical protein
MPSLLLLILITALIVFLQKKIWDKANVIIFPLCTAVFYYWCLSGAWIFIIDQSFNELGRKFNMTYYNYLEKVYPVKLDSTYTLMILYYGLFILVFQLCILIGLKLCLNKNKVHLNTSVFKLHPFIISSVSIFFIFLSYKIVEIPILKSIKLEESIYINVRKGIVSYYTLHQLLNLGASFLMYFYFANYLKSNNLNIGVVKSKIGNYFFFLCFILLNIWLVFLGNRHEILISGIIAFLYLTFPTFKKKQINSVIFLIFVLAFSFLITDPLRSLTPKILSSYKNSYFITTKNKEINDYLQAEVKFSNSLNDNKVVIKTIQKVSDDEHDSIIIPTEELEINNTNQLSNLHCNNVSHVYYNLSTLDKFRNTIAAVLFSNEMFSGQFSMYAVLKEEIKISFGHSIKSMIYSFIPKSITKRPESSYEYYANRLKLDKNQGFTINHATDWYLNFGIFGIFIGGLFWGTILFSFYYGTFYVNADKIRFFLYFSLFNIVAYFPIIIRGGVDIMKIIIFESVLIPFLLVYITHLIYVLYLHLKNILISNKYR